MIEKYEEREAIKRKKERKKETETRRERIVFVIGGRWPYSWCLVGCFRQDLFKIARRILV